MLMTTEVCMMITEWVCWFSLELWNRIVTTPSQAKQSIIFTYAFNKFLLSDYYSTHSLLIQKFLFSDDYMPGIIVGTGDICKQN